MTVVPKPEVLLFTRKKNSLINDDILLNRHLTTVVPNPEVLLFTRKKTA